MGVFVYARSTSQIDVTTAIAMSNDGDTVVVPPGTTTWANILSIKKAITLQCAGIGKTIISGTVAWTLESSKYYAMRGIELTKCTVHIPPGTQSYSMNMTANKVSEINIV